MTLTSLGYIGIQTDRLDDFSSFSTALLGTQEIDRARSSHAFQMDDRSQRPMVSRDRREGLSFLEWGVERRQDLEPIGALVEDYGVRITQASATLTDQRLVQALIWFEDPPGNRHEVFWKPMLAVALFPPGRPISGFKTGAFGMGHAVLNVEDATPLLPFYTEVLGFSVTDFGRTPYQLYFFHLNSRDHSFSMVGSGRRGVHHFMVEMGSLDHVGQGYDLAQHDEGRIAYALGRHTNDHMTSVYATRHLASSSNMAGAPRSSSPRPGSHTRLSMGRRSGGMTGFTWRSSRANGFRTCGSMLPVAASGLNAVVGRP